MDNQVKFQIDILSKLDNLEIIIRGFDKDSKNTWNHFNVMPFDLDFVSDTDYDFLVEDV